MSFFSNAINAIKAFFSKAIQKFKDLISEAIPPAKQIILGELSEFATKTVLELKSTDLKSEEKRATAFSNIKGFAKQNAIEAKDSLINLLIELAVQKFKNEE